MKTSVALLVCAFFVAPAWGQGPSFDVPVDLDLIGAVRAVEYPWNYSNPYCCVIMWGSTARLGTVWTGFRVPQFWDESNVELRFNVIGYPGVHGEVPGPGNEYQLHVRFECDSGDSYRQLFIPYPTASETVEASINIDDLVSVCGAQPGGTCEAYFNGLGHTNCPGCGVTYYGAAVLYFHVVLPLTEGDCNWDGVVDAADMACLVNAVFN